MPADRTQTTSAAMNTPTMEQIPHATFYGRIAIYFGLIPVGENE